LVNFPFGWAHDGGDTYTSSMNLFTPINRRFELEWEVPFVVSGRGPDGDRHTAFGDFAVTTRFLLSETVDFTQSLNVVGNFAAGYYFTPHDLTPIGDLV